MKKTYVAGSKDVHLRYVMQPFRSQAHRGQCCRRPSTRLTQQQCFPTYGEDPDVGPELGKWVAGQPSLLAAPALLIALFSVLESNS